MGPPASLPATQELIDRVGWFIWLRWLAVVAVLVVVEVARRALPITFYPGPLYLVVAALALYNLAVSLAFPAIRRPRQAGGDWQPAGSLARIFLPSLGPAVQFDRDAGRAALFASLQIVVDLLFLAVLIHFSGGIENPLRVFFVLHLIIAAILLSRSAAYVFATVGLGFYAAVVLGELTGLLPHYPLHADWRPDAYLDATLVGTQLFFFAVMLYAAAYLGSAIEVRLQRREVDVIELSRQLAEKADHLAKAYALLSAAEKTKSQYMRKVAHELRGPLGMIRTALGAVLETPSAMPREQRLDLMRRAYRRSGELAEVTQQLLTLARARTNSAAVMRAPLQPVAVAATVIDEVRASAEKKGITLVVSADPSTGEILGDAEGLADLMNNLLSNAIRYTPSGGRVEFRLRQEGDGVAIEVADTGIGIRQEDLPKIYEEFYRSKAAREAVPEGSGLGMAIVKAVVDRHGGAIAVESAVGKGTRVTITIPRG